MTDHPDLTTEQIEQWRAVMMSNFRNGINTPQINVLCDMALRASIPEGCVLAEVGAERKRQIEKEGWTPQHDDSHTGGVMAVAAACYALHSSYQQSESEYWRDRYEQEASQLWPWDEEWWKPKNPRRDLVRAAALIVAEIERLDRSAAMANKAGT